MPVIGCTASTSTTERAEPSWLRTNSATDCCTIATHGRNQSSLRTRSARRPQAEGRPVSDRPASWWRWPACGSAVGRSVSSVTEHSEVDSLLPANQTRRVSLARSGSLT